MIDKRQLTRQQLIYHLRVFDQHQPRLIGYLANITTKGFSLISEKALKVNTQYQFRMTLPEQLSPVTDLNFEARACWCAPHENPIFYNTGFEFQCLSLQKIQVIEELIRRFGFVDCFSSRAVKLYKGIEGLNCAQAILKTYQSEFSIEDDIIQKYAIYGNGMAEDSMCGALFSAKLFLNTGQFKALQNYFLAEIESLDCDDILLLGRISCAGAIYTVDRFIREIIKIEKSVELNL